ncbi:MAG: hypothetical protein LBH05_05380 [Deferribacteraceae bacterium]|jgi:hypothetical protein|nr:hypothetical protein [Deferribacteraceae bacterium]
MKKRFKKAEIAAIDARANDTKKITNEKPVKINMSMDELAKKLLNVVNKR